MTPRKPAHHPERRLAQTATLTLSVTFLQPQWKSRCKGHTSLFLSLSLSLSPPPPSPRPSCLPVVLSFLEGGDFECSGLSGCQTDDLHVFLLHIFYKCYSFPFRSSDLSSNSLTPTTPHYPLLSPRPFLSWSSPGHWHWGFVWCRFVVVFGK